MTGLYQTGNPEVLLKLREHWRRYLRKIDKRFHEAELNKLVSCFKADSERRLHILVQEGNIVGFCVLTIDPDTQALFVSQASVDDAKLLKKEIDKKAKEIGATAIMFCTERNSKAWERLIKARTIGHVMEV